MTNQEIIKLAQDSGFTAEIIKTSEDNNYVLVSLARRKLYMMEVQEALDLPGEAIASHPNGVSVFGNDVYGNDS